MHGVILVVSVILFSYWLSPKDERKQVRKDLKDLGNLFMKWFDRK